MFGSDVVCLNCRNTTTVDDFEKKKSISNAFILWTSILRFIIKFESRKRRFLKYE